MALFERKKEKLIDYDELEKVDNRSDKEKMVAKLVSAVSNLNEEETVEFLDNFNETEFLVHREIISLYFNSATMEIKGIANIVGGIATQDNCYKTLGLIDENGDVAYEIPVKMIHIPQENDTNPESLNGYQCTVNFGKLNNNKPIKPGKYDVRIKIRQFHENKWVNSISNLGAINSKDGDFILSTTMFSFSAKSNKKYSLTAELGEESQNLVITSKLLSDINPLEYDLEEDIEMDLPAIRKTKNATFVKLYKLFSFLPVKKKKVSFISDSRIDISGNFEFIYNKMLERKSDFDISFYLKSSIKERKTWREIVTLAYNAARSRYIILDDYYPMIYPVEIREKSDLVQVWHAVGAFKTFGYSRLGMPGGPKLTSLDHRNYTKVLVSSENIVDKYAEGFGISRENVFPIGAPRTDIFFDTEAQKAIIEELHEELEFIEGKKVILFAPTFRGNGQQSAHYPFEMIDFKKMYDELASKGWILLLKIHPFVQNKPSIPYEYQDFIFDVSDYREINNLLLVTDIMITDYSSVCFEYALLRKKMIFFSPDLGEYMSTRNFYYDYYDFIPGPYVANTDELINEIVDPFIDLDRINDFITYFFDDLDGKSSERFIDYLENDFYEEEEDEEDEVQYTEDGKIIPHWGKRKKVKKIHE